MQRRTLLKYMGAMTSMALGPGISFGDSFQTATPPAGVVLEGVFFNQLGFQPAREKIATLVPPASVAEEAKSFRVRVDGTGAVIFEGKLSPATADEASGDIVHQADFSMLNTPG